MSIGKSIKIYLDGGSVSGIRHAEIVNWTGQAISSPRLKIKALKLWEESKKPGVYFLFGVDEESGDDAVYIGEAENVLDRLQNHLVNKSFWNEAVFFTSKDENLTKAHVRYLESRIIKLAKQSSRHVILNVNEPQLPALPRGDRDSMDEFIANLKILLGVVGYKTLESIGEEKIRSNTEQKNETKNSKNTDFLELFLKVKGINAQAHQTDEGIVVLADSYASKNATDSLSNGSKKLRDKLIYDGLLKETNKRYIFTRNYLFTSPSQAASIIVGYATNGLNNWKTKNGTTLKSIEEQN
jgi:hypothetical protein